MTSRNTFEMNKLLKYSVFAIAFLLVSGISSCQKQTLNRLQGSWTRIPVDDPFTDEVETWEFADGDFIIYFDGAKDSPYERGTYTLNATFFETTLDLQPTIDKTFMRHYTGEWQVYEITANHMTLLHFIEDDHGMTMREFERD